MTPAQAPLEPTPYRVKHENCIYHGDYFVCKVHETKDVPYQEQENRAYAAHIVSALNSHEAMRVALQKIAEITGGMTTLRLNRKGRIIPCSNEFNINQIACAALALANKNGDVK